MILREVKQIKLSQFNYTVNCHGVSYSCILSIQAKEIIFFQKLIRLLETLGMCQNTTFADFEKLDSQWNKFAFSSMVPNVFVGLPVTCS